MITQLSQKINGSDLHPDEQRQELTEHLAELRTRLIRAAIYIVIGMTAMWLLFEPLFKIISAPIITALAEVSAKLPPEQRALAGTFVFHGFHEAFFTQLKISMIAGIAVAAPLITLELWGFVTPALTKAERQWASLIAPFSSLLFIFGAGLAYWIMPAAVHWFLLYLGDFPHAILLQDPQDYILFLVKMMLAFGIVFQLPIMMMALGKLGIINSGMLTKYWRYIICGLWVAAMIITPSNDPLSMTMMAFPLCVLFLFSIWLVKLVEKKPDGPVVEKMER